MKINNNNYLTNVLLICVKIKIVFFSIFDLKQHDFRIKIMAPRFGNAYSVRLLIRHCQSELASQSLKIVL